MHRDYTVQYVGIDVYSLFEKKEYSSQYLSITYEIFPPSIYWMGNNNTVGVGSITITN